MCDGRIYFGCEDGYLYVLGPKGKAALPSDDLQLSKIRSPLTGKFADPKYDRFTSFVDWSNTNADNNHKQFLKPPFKLNWIRRYEGTIKHFSTCGGGRMYTHTAEGQIFAVEQKTGRLLWRKYFPGAHVSYTSALYYKDRLLVPQAGLTRCRMRCLDAATGKLLWEAPFSGSPNWNRQIPPVIYKNLAIYMFSTGKYKESISDKDKLKWLFAEQTIPGFPKDHKPLLRAWDVNTGEEVWTKDFSNFGTGGDEASVCMLGDTLYYYSCYFGHSARIRKGLAGPKGLTAAIDPVTGQIVWLTTRYFVHGGTSISGKDGRLYLGGYNAVEGGTDTKLSFGYGNIMTDTVTGKQLFTKVWCLDAKDGSLIWESDDLFRAINVATITDRFVFTHAQNLNGYLIDKDNGKIRAILTKGYKCTRFNISWPYLFGTNMDIIDVSNPDNIKLVSSGPALDIAGCMSPIVSNGRMFYTSVGAGMQASHVFGAEAELLNSLWRN